MAVTGGVGGASPKSATAWGPRKRWRKQRKCLIRVAMAQGKQGIWFLLFPDRENTGNFVVTQGKNLKHRENILTVIINIKSMFIFLKFKNFSAKCAQQSIILAY